MKTRREVRKPNYLAPLIEGVKAQLDIGIPKPGSIGHAFVYHDNWCAIFKGGVCNCNPDIKYAIQDERGIREVKQPGKG